LFVPSIAGGGEIDPLLVVGWESILPHRAEGRVKVESSHVHPPAGT
jgi:hypothetical protein